MNWLILNKRLHQVFFVSFFVRLLFLFYSYFFLNLKDFIYRADELEILFIVMFIFPFFEVDKVYKVGKYQIGLGLIFFIEFLGRYLL